MEGLVLKLKLQYFGHLIRRKDSDVGRDSEQEETEVTDHELVG